MRRGSLRVVATTAHGVEVTLAIRGPGELVGDLGPLTGRNAAAGVVAREPSEVVVIPPDRFVRLVRTDPAAGAEVFDRLAQALAEADRRLVAWSTQPLAARVAAELVARCEQTGRDTVALTHAELAGLCGASRSAVSELLAGLRGDGVIANGRGRVVILDRGALQGLATSADRGRDPGHHPDVISDSAVADSGRE